MSVKILWNLLKSKNLRKNKSLCGRIMFTVILMSFSKGFPRFADKRVVSRGIACLLKLGSRAELGN